MKPGVGQKGTLAYVWAPVGSRPAMVRDDRHDSAHLFRANKLCRLVWDSYEAVLAACRDAWNFLINDPERIRSIGTRDWACVNVYGGWYKCLILLGGRTRTRTLDPLIGRSLVCR